MTLKKDSRAAASAVALLLKEYQKSSSKNMTKLFLKGFLQSYDKCRKSLATITEEGSLTNGIMLFLMEAGQKIVAGKQSMPADPQPASSEKAARCFGEAFGLFFSCIEYGICAPHFSNSPRAQSTVTKAVQGNILYGIERHWSVELQTGKINLNPIRKRIEEMRAEHSLSSGQQLLLREIAGKLNS